MRPSFTKEKFEELEKELIALLIERKAAVIDLKKARDMGDLSENGYYKSARMKLTSVDRRLRELKYFTSKGVVITKTHSSIIQLGSTVSLKTETSEISYTIVGSFEANPKDAKISDESPLGKILLGKKVGETVTMNEKSYLIEKVA